MPGGSTVVITVAGVDVTNRVMFRTARFEGQQGAVPGSAEMTLKDPAQVLSFFTGDEWTLDVDGVRLWGGYVMLVNGKFAFPAVKTTVPAAVKTRQFLLQGVDYNFLFDKRVIHNPANHLSALPFFGLDRTMGELLREDLFPDFLDLGGDGLDTTTFVDDGFVPRFDASGNPNPDGTKQGSWVQQGLYWRAQMEDFSQFGFVYYIDPSKNVHFHEVESTLAAWGFSDVPNKLALPNAAATYGMREYEDTADAAAMANDAFVWGGSEWSGSSGGTVFARKQNPGSITDHGRWQYAETRFGELKSQGEVTARANVISSGNTTGAVGGDTSRGLAVEQKQIRLSWFAHDVPTLAGNRVHLKPSDVVTVTMYTLSDDGGVTPKILVLPLRTVKISFPILDTQGRGYVRFDGFFGVQLSDPWWLWKFLRDLNTRPKPRIIATADSSSTAVVYGTYGSFEPSPLAPFVAGQVLTIQFGYIVNTSVLYLNGLPQRRGTDYTESTPENGEFTWLGRDLISTDKLWVEARLIG